MKASTDCTYGTVRYQLILGPNKDKCICLHPMCRFKTKNYHTSESACREIESHIDAAHEMCAKIEFGTRCEDASLHDSEFCLQHANAAMLGTASARRKRADDDGPMYPDSGKVERIFL